MSKIVVCEIEVSGIERQVRTISKCDLEGLPPATSGKGQALMGRRAHATAHQAPDKVSEKNASGPPLWHACRSQDEPSRSLNFGSLGPMRPRPALRSLRGDARLTTREPSGGACAP